MNYSRILNIYIALICISFVYIIIVGLPQIVVHPSFHFKDMESLLGESYLSEYKSLRKSNSEKYLKENEIMMFDLAELNSSKERQENIEKVSHINFSGDRELNLLFMVDTLDTLEKRQKNQEELHQITGYYVGKILDFGK